MMGKIDPSEITPESVYLSRRELIRAAGVATVGQLVLSACGSRTVGPASRRGPVAPPSGLGGAEGAAGDGAPPVAGASTDELGDKLTDYEAVTTYNNFYEFSVDKDQPARLARNFITSPWSVQVGGLVNNPTTFGVDDLLMRFDQEERIYRLRCVEGWSMVIPWVGFPLAKLIEPVEPTSRAKYVRFETLHDPDQMPGLKRVRLDWPYVEGLRLDEAMNDLALLSTGIYGKSLLPQNGAPIRLVVPWKYGFKSIKSIVKIDLVDQMPRTTWVASAPHEYTFFANVDPEVDHPRWSQATERRIGELRRRPTLLYNGYAEEVAELYADGSGSGRVRPVG